MPTALESAPLRQLLEPLYASVEDGDITPFYESLQRFTQSSAVCTIEVDFIRPGGRVDDLVGFPTPEEIERIEQSYEQNFAPRNTIVETIAPHMDTGAVLRVSDYRSFNNLRETDYFKGFLHPLGVDYTTGLVIERDAECARLISLSRALGDIDYRDADIALLNELVPHIQRVCRLMSYTEGMLRWEILEAAGVHALQLEADGRVHRMTDAMADLVAGRRLFDLHRGCLKGANFVVHQVLQQLRSLVLQADISKQAAPEESVFDLDGRCWTLTAFLGAPRTSFHLLSSTWLLVLKETTASFADQYLVQYYGLTHAECICALSLPDAGNLPRLARKLGLSLNTVKSHLRVIYQKTDTHSQAELVTLLAQNGLLK